MSLKLSRSSPGICPTGDQHGCSRDARGEQELRCHSSHDRSAEALHCSQRFEATFFTTIGDNVNASDDHPTVAPAFVKLHCHPTTMSGSWNLLIWVICQIHMQVVVYWFVSQLKTTRRLPPSLCLVAPCCFLEVNILEVYLTRQSCGQPRSIWGVITILQLYFFPKNMCCTVNFQWNSSLFGPSFKTAQRNKKPQCQRAWMYVVSLQCNNGNPTVKHGRIIISHNDRL